MFSHSVGANTSFVPVRPRPTTRRLLETSIEQNSSADNDDTVADGRMSLGSETEPAPQPGPQLEPQSGMPLLASGSCDTRKVPADPTNSDHPADDSADEDSQASSDEVEEIVDMRQLGRNTW